MPNFDEIFRGAYVKLRHGRSHLAKILALERSLPDDRYKLVVLHGPSPQLGGRVAYDLRYEPVGRIDDDFALAIGDTVQNFRSALDMMASGIVHRHRPAARMYFPIPKTAAELASNAHARKLEEALPGSMQLLIDEVRPVDSPNEALWAFTGLDNDNKHNRVLPTVMVGAFEVANMRVGQKEFRDCSFGGGNAMMPMKLILSEFPIEIESKPRMAAYAHFGEPGPFEGELVVPILSRVGTLVEDTIMRFEVLAHS